MTPEATLTALREIVGPSHLLTSDADQAPFVTDWRKRYTGAALAVVLPADTAQVARVVALCMRADVPIVPQGGNTGLVGGATPDASRRAVLVSLRRLNRVRAIDTDNDTLTAEAGCTLHAVQEAAQAAGRLFPLSLAAEGSATLGGNLATNAGGTQVLRYGHARDLTLGVEVVLPSGEVLHGLRGLRKDNTGYDLRGLFVGAEGTLGIITAATVKLYPLPRATRTAIVALPSLAAASNLLHRARARADAALTAFEVMSVVCLDELARQLPPVRQPLPRTAPWYALLEISDSESEAHAQQQLESMLSEALEAGLASDAAIAQSLAESAAFWQVRESIPEAQARAGGNVKHDIALPVSAITGFVATTDAALKARFPWIKPVVFGHLGDGNLHYNMGVVDGAALTLAFEHEPAINQLVHDAVAAHGGSISAEHGIGQLKRAMLPQYKSRVELDLMRAIKAALDPRGLMNPGKLL